MRADLGGLLLEMARRDAFNPLLLEAKARAAVVIEEEIAALDARVLEPPIVAAAPVVVVQVSSCARCHGEVAAAANFCPFCGAPRGDG